MSTLNEIEARCGHYHTELKKALSSSYGAAAQNKITEESYKRIIAYSALSFGILPNCTPESQTFYKEAHNDMITGHILALLGSYRSALISLRNALENVLHFLYYKDHSIELKLWLIGKHRLKITSLFDYENEKHLFIGKHIQPLTPVLLKEYTELSRAVHGSAINYQMTNSFEFPNAIGYDAPRLSMWNTRARSLHNAMVQLLLYNFEPQFEGTKLSHQREVIAGSITEATATAVSSNTSINLIIHGN